MRMRLSELVPDGGILCGLECTGRDEAIRSLIQCLERSDRFPATLSDPLFDRAIDRERKNSTGFGLGVAVPHVKHPDVPRASVALGLSRHGIDFASLDKQPVYLVVLLISPEDRPEEHLQAMEAVFGHLKRETFRRFLRQASTPEEVRELLVEAERQQVTG